MADTKPENNEVEVEEKTEFRYRQDWQCIFVQFCFHNSSVTKFKTSDILKGICYFYYSQLSGNHIAVTVWSYFHHGIVIHSEYGVVNCGGENKKDAATKNLWGEKRLVRINYPNRKPIDVIKTAKRLKENPNEWGKYNLFKNNCEHFATYCKLE